MAKPYRTLRDQLSPDAPRDAEAPARALLADDTRQRLAHLRSTVHAMAQTLEDAEAMPGGGSLQAAMDTAWNALVALDLALEEWGERHAEDEP